MPPDLLVCTAKRPENQDRKGDLLAGMAGKTQAQGAASGAGPEGEPPDDNLLHLKSNARRPNNALSYPPDILQS